MSIQEVLKFIEGFKGDAAAGFIVIIYYLIVYWPKIRDGLGLSLGKKLDYDRVEKNYQLLKLKIEIEKIKKDSGLEPELLDKLENEMLARQEIKKGKPFTPVQKFVAIPLLILTSILVLMELHSPNPDTDTTDLDTIIGGIFIAIITIVGFWGIPLLQQATNNILRKIGFIIFWMFGFYILAYMFSHIAVTAGTDATSLSDTAGGYIFLASLIASITLGLLGRLPLMRQANSIKYIS